MVHATQFTRIFHKPLNCGLVYTIPKRTRSVLISCTASPKDTAAELAASTETPASILVDNNTAPPTSPLYQPKFDAMYAELALWRSKYRTTIVPRNAHDAGELGDWVAAIRRLHRRGTLPAWAIEKLNELDMDWKVDVLTAKWHANFHATREFKEAHGGETCDLDTALPPDWGTKNKINKNGKTKGEGVDGEEKGEVRQDEGEIEDPKGEEGVHGEEKGEDSQESVRADWVEAARWLERQRELFVTEKLTDYRVWVLKRVLGIRLRRPYAPRRKNMHPVLLKQNAAFKKLVAKDEAKAAAAAAADGGC